MRIFTNRADRRQWAGDASIYHLVPRAVAFPDSCEDVRQLLARGKAETFRAGGMSLSGQAVSDGIMADASMPPWRGIGLLDGGRLVRCGPGAVVAWVNAPAGGAAQRADGMIRRSP